MFEFSSQLIVAPICQNMVPHESFPMHTHSIDAPRDVEIE